MASLAVVVVVGFVVEVKVWGRGVNGRREERVGFHGFHN